MKHIYKKTVTTVFLVPTLNISREDLFKNKFINGYIADINKDDYFEEDVVFLLFQPEDIDLFREFVQKEYDLNKFIIEDYDYENNYVVLVYQLNPELKEDIELIKQSKYSKVSQQFKDLFPKKLINYKDPDRKKTISIQHWVFDKKRNLLDFWERQFNTTLNEESELWPEFSLKKEILDIEKILEDDRNNK